MTETTEMAIPTVHDTLPTTFEEVSGLAKAFVASGMFPDVKSLSQAIVKIQAGRELGLPPVYSTQNIILIKGRLTSNANTLALLVRRSGKYDYRITSHTDDHCTIEFSQIDAGKLTKLGESTFTMADAKRADLVKPDSGWIKYPRAMLFSRAISQGARIYCPDAIGGIYTEEEIRSIPVESSTIENQDEFDKLPSVADHLCAIHQVTHQRHEKNGKIWYSHKLPDGTWCNEETGQGKAIPPPATSKPSVAPQDAAGEVVEQPSASTEKGRIEQFAQWFESIVWPDGKKLTREQIKTKLGMTLGEWLKSGKTINHAVEYIEKAI